MLRLLLLSEWEMDREMDKRNKYSSKFQMSWKEAFMPLFGELKRRGGGMHFIYSAPSIFLSITGVVPMSVTIGKLPNHRPVVGKDSLRAKNE